MGAPPCDNRPPPIPADARRPPPRSPGTEQSPPPLTSHTRTVGPPEPRPLPQLPGPLPMPAFPGTLPPAPPPPRAERGLRLEAWRQAGRGHDRGKGARGREYQTESRGRRRGDKAPRLRGRGEAPGDRAAGLEQRTTDDRPRQTGPGPAAGGDGARQAAPRRGAATRHATQPARRDRRIRAARSAAVNGGKAVVAGATGEGVWGGVGARGAPLPPKPPAQPRGTWRGSRAGRGTPETTPPSAGQGGGAPPAGDGGAEGPAGRGEQDGREPPFPPDLRLSTPPPTFSRGSSSWNTREATGPDRPGRGAFQTSFPPSVPVPRR
ncbi:basic salivary proline-rich protein 2-like [Bubalus bubalis]|uniref:basic salivary proline-rich protein 2-like n=1 Tax=Bubalus bubalis TaxID=89462 RepID=UPI001E1B9390|nr:basic salivary proline-rich protein 2-like [Bubalus bubalis]